MLVLEAGDARVEVDEAAGGRLGSLVVEGRELLVTTGHEPGPFYWGCYPMAPWAGRVRRGRFSFGGEEHGLPINFPPHAIHGTVFTRPWTVQGEAVSSSDLGLSIDLGPDWPWPGRVVQHLELEPAALHLRIEVRADDAPMPASCGWHPWFRRDLGAGSGELDVDLGAMYVRDADGIPTGEFVDPPPGPWDDCFTRLAGPPRLRWPGGPTLTVESTCDDYVIYDRLPHAICVEPQTGPPDALNLGPAVVEPGQPLVAEATFRWA